MAKSPVKPRTSSDIYQLRPQCDNVRIAIIAYMTETKSPYGLADFELAKNLWKSLKFKVIPIENPSWDDLQREVKRVIREINTHAEFHDVFSFTLVGHGGIEVRTHRGRKYKFEFFQLTDCCVGFDELRGMFIPSKCPGLAGNAKCFFLQCCRGRKRETPYQMPASAAGTCENNDFYTLYSCVTDHVSLYSLDSGKSDFISTLCKVFKREFENNDIASMATAVNRKFQNKRQTVEQTSTLSKKLYFRGEVISYVESFPTNINPSNKLSNEEDGGSLIHQYQGLSIEKGGDHLLKQNQARMVRNLVAKIEEDTKQDIHEDKNTNKARTVRNPVAKIEEDTKQDIHEDKNANKGILSDLGLEEVMLYKFGLKDMLTITRSSIKGEKIQTIREKILNIISKKVMLDYNSRQLELSLQCDKNKKKSNNPDNEITNNSDEDDELRAIHKGRSVGYQPKNRYLLHPLDVITIIMNCCENSLRQVIVQKMVMCQLAIPLVFPNFHGDEPLFILWAMQLIEMNLKTQLKKAPDINAVNYATPIISAIRLGELTMSKSKIINDILCNQTHNTFFHRDSEFGNRSRKLSNGLVELAWYLPGGEKEDFFDNMIAITNLRGDAKNHSKQFELVSNISSVILIFLSIQSISDREYCLMIRQLSTLNLQLLFIFLDEVNKQNSNEIYKLMGEKKFKSVLGFVDGQAKNAVLLTSEIRKKIDILLKKNLEPENLKWDTIFETASNFGIKVDKDSECCSKGKNMAVNVISKIKSNDVKTIKRKFLPLQGQLWSEWSCLSKKQARLGNVPGGDNEIFISDCIQKKKICREKQFNLVDKINPVIKEFIQNLEQTKNNLEIRIYFMQWMKFYLDIISYKELPVLHRNYQTLWDKIRLQKKMKQNNADIMMAQDKLLKVEKDLIASSLGLVHFMRELGQVYEAIIEHKHIATNTFNSYHLLPKFAAELLISGFPLEIMDGDVGHMPLTWVKAVFDSIKSELGNKKLYVISVLGVQSSGKSTLINTMFGLNLPVSAGRCTKGVFAQLIKVDVDLNCELGYDYILVLDTEGLRAPEQGDSKLNHDNELATLVIGLGDVTIVNIKGENTAEIEDILQISVHAFLRMQLTNKNLKLQPGCYFAHQNVSAINAEEKMTYAYKKIQEQLDVIAKEAARQEGSIEIQSFNDVIDFDVKNNVWYFPSLWQGDPPMAPANPMYSNKVQDLKNILLKYPLQKDINCLTFTDLQTRMSDLWKALLYEKFVFSFRNSLEVKSYKSLEEKYSSMFWDFRKEVRKWIHGSVNEILSCQEKDINSLQSSLLALLGVYIDKYFSKYDKELDIFFTSSKDKDILVKWKSETKLRLQSLSDELTNEAKKTCRSCFELRRAQFVKENQTDSYQKQLGLYVKELVSTHVKEERTEMSDKSLKKKFAKKWDEWMKMLSFEEIKEKNIKEDVITVLTNIFKANGPVLQIELNKYESSKSEFHVPDIFPNIETEDYKSLLTSKGKNAMDIEDPKIKIHTFTCEILDEIKNFINENKHQDYDKTILYDIYNRVNEKIKISNSNEPYELLINYSIKVTVFILICSISLLKKRHRQFINENDPQHFLKENVRPQLEKFFLGTISQCMQEKTAADILRSYLEKGIVEKLKRELPQVIADKIRSTCKEFHTKTSLYCKVLDKFGTAKSFDMCIQFINKPDTIMNSFLEDYVSKYCKDIKTNGNSNLANEAKEILSKAVKTLKKSVKEVNAHMSTNGISFPEWIVKFQNIVKRTVFLRKSIFDNVGLKKVKDIDYFVERVDKDLEKIQAKLEQQLNTWSVGDLDEKPHVLLATSLLGCTERCPFCQAMCMHTIAGHTGPHSNPHHRPQGIVGHFNRATRSLLLESCNVHVAGNGTFTCNNARCYCNKPGGEMHPYATYASAGPRYAAWSIPPDTSLEVGQFWKWCFCTFGPQFEKRLKCVLASGEKLRVKCPNFPSSWLSITWEDAKASIKDSV